MAAASLIQSPSLAILSTASLPGAGQSSGGAPFAAFGKGVALPCIPAAGRSATTHVGAFAEICFWAVGGGGDTSMSVWATTPVLGSIVGELVWESGAAPEDEITR